MAESKFNSLTSMPSAGMNRLGDPAAINPAEYTCMLNGSLYDIGGSAPVVRMYKGNRLSFHLPVGYRPVGSVNISQEATCLFLASPATGDSEIGIWNGVSYRTVANSPDLNLSVQHQVQAVVDKDYNGALTVIWVDNHNPIRFMDLNNPPELNNALDVDALNVFRKYKYPQARVSSIESQGRLLAGSYYISLQYADENGNGLTACSTPIGPIHIYRDSITQAKESINGSPDREPTSKAIKVGLTNLDTSFKYLNVVVVKSYAGIRSAVIASTIPTFQTTYLYTGNPDVERDIDLKEVVAPAVGYSTAKTISLSNGTVLLGNLKGKREYNLQPFISRVGVQWQLLRERYTSETSYANPLNCVYGLQYRRNEVYALGLVIRWNDGSKSRVYPFVGRKVNQDSFGNVINLVQDEHGQPVDAGHWDDMNMQVSADLFEGGQSPKRYQAFNTAFVLGNDLPSGQEEGPERFGEMGYWESTERYPDNPAVWGEDAGQPIRLFRMPDHSVAPLTDGENGTKDDKAPVFTYKLGIRFTNIEQVINALPQEVRDQMEGWEIVRADRRNNKSVIASGLVHNMWYQDWSDSQSSALSSWAQVLGTTLPDMEGDNDVRLYQNYPHNDLRPDPYILKNGTTNDNHQYRKDIFSFISPDTSFNRNMLFTGEVLIHKELYGQSRYRNAFLQPYPELKDKGNNEDDSAYQVMSVATYNNWLASKPGNLRRKIKECMYIPFNSQVAGGNVGVPVHNLMREGTVLLATEGEIDDPTKQDTTRKRLFEQPINGRVGVSGIMGLASAHYVTIMSRIANQYGSVYDARYCFTNLDNTLVKDNQLVFGGDSYIAPHSQKRQMVYFQNAQAYMEWEDGSDGVDLKTSENIKNTTFYYLAKRKNTRRDSRTEGQVNDSTLSSGWGLLGGIVAWGIASAVNDADLGMLPMIYSGVPVFFCESDYNIDLRINGGEPWNTYYPNLKDGAMPLHKWMGIEHIDKPEEFLQNPSYSEINDLYGYTPPDPFYKPESMEVTHFATRVLYSLKGSPEQHFNNLLVFLPLNYHDFERDKGELWDIRDLGNYNILFKLEHGLYLNKLYAGVEAEGGKVYLGSGQLFQTSPMLLVKTESGYGGSSAQWATNSTPFGTFFVDGQRHAVFQYADGPKEITANGMDNWFQEHLPLRLLQDIPDFPYKDNPANDEGIGYSSVWDHDSKLWILTKTDYELIDKDEAGNFTVENGVLQYNNAPVSLKNKALFRNRSFTIGYSPLTQKWISWYSFVSGTYFELGTKYYSFGRNAIWCHDNPVPRTYYGQRYPFTFEGVLKNGGVHEMAHTASFLTRTFPLSASGQFQGESRTLTFNKAHLYNFSQSTGEMVLTVQDENKLSTLLRAEVRTATSKETFLRRRDHLWGFGQIYDYVKDPLQPFVREAYNDEYYIDQEIDHSNHDYARDYREFAYLNDMWLKMRLTFDQEVDVQMFLYLEAVLGEVSVK